MTLGGGGYQGRVDVNRNADGAELFRAEGGGAATKPRCSKGAAALQGTGLFLSAEKWVGRAALLLVP